MSKAKAGFPLGFPAETSYNFNQISALSMPHYGFYSSFAGLSCRKLQEGRVDMKHIYILSSTAGDTGERVVKATLAQFDTSGIHIYRKSHLRTLDEIKTAIDEVEKQPGLIVYTLVDSKHAN